MGAVDGAVAGEIGVLAGQMQASVDRRGAGRGRAGVGRRAEERVRPGEGPRPRMSLQTAGAKIHSRNMTSGAWKINWVKQKPTMSRALRPRTPSSGSIQNGLIRFGSASAAL